MSKIEMVPGIRADQDVPSRLACSYERPDLGWDKPLRIYVATDRDMVTVVFPWSQKLHKGGGSAHYGGKDALSRAERRMEQFVLECQPRPQWEGEIPTMNGFPAGVKGFDWAALPMTAPPQEETHVGYHSWYDKKPNGEGDVTVDCYCDCYVLPDGGAKIVRRRGNEVEEEVFALGTWKPDYPSTNLGARGGIWIQAKYRESETVTA